MNTGTTTRSDFNSERDILQSNCSEQGTRLVDRAT